METKTIPNPLFFSKNNLANNQLLLFHVTC